MKYRQLDKKRRGKLGVMADQIEDEAEGRIDDLYSYALENTMRSKKAAFRRMRDIMDGVVQPPRHLTTPEQQQRWKEKELRKVLADSGVANALALAIAQAGNQSTKIIKRAGLKTFQTIYNGEMEKLEDM